MEDNPPLSPPGRGTKGVGLIPTDNIKTALGIDVGLKEFLTTNTGETVSVPNFYRKAQSNLARKQRKASRKEFGSNNWKKAR